MSIPRSSDGLYIDNRSTTLDDAAEFERYFNSHMYYEDNEDYDDEDYDDEDYDERDDCRCSDPCCPCSGNKIGIP